MSLLTSAIKGLAGVAKSDALKEAERLLAPKTGFFSKLEEAVTGLNFTKMPSQQLRKTMEGRQVSPLEYDNVLGQMEGTVSKEEVMGMIGKNKTEFKDVVLGEPRITEKVNMSPDRAYGLYKEGMISADDYAQVEKTGFIEKSIKRPVHYEQYSEPGYIPGSYRERFVTAPSESKGNTAPKNYLKIKEELEKFYQTPEADNLNIRDYRKKESAISSKYGLDWDKYIDLKVKDNRGDFDGKWKDGHSSYSDIQNPVVRLRTNDREVNGKKILFVEEMQGPSKENQDKMPEYLRKRIYDIGVKKSLMLAREGGYDGVAWTTGEMQADRYNLAKHLDKISWSSSDRFNKTVDVWMKDNRLIHLKVNDEGIITSGEFFQRRLDEVVGKDISKNILDSIDGSLSNLDLKVGGEGLKYLYDKQLPSLFKKYGKGDVKELKLRTFDEVEKESKLTSVPYLPITEKTPSRHPVYSMIPPTLAGMTAMYRTGEGNAQ